MGSKAKSPRQVLGPSLAAGLPVRLEVAATRLDLKFGGSKNSSNPARSSPNMLHAFIVYVTCASSNHHAFRDIPLHTGRSTFKCSLQHIEPPCHSKSASQDFHTSTIRNDMCFDSSFIHHRPHDNIFADTKVQDTRSLDLATQNVLHPALVDAIPKVTRISAVDRTHV